MAATPSPPFDPAALARFLAEASGAERVETGDFELLAGGAIQENWGFTALFSGGRLSGRHDLVLRTDAPTGIASSLSRVEEFAVLQAVFAAGVRVPEPIFACAEATVIGKPFFVMRRLAGTTQGRLITADPALEPALPQLAHRLGRELARMQTIRPPRSDLAFLPVIGPKQHIANFRAYLDRHPNPRPVLEWATSWLETHVPEPLPPVLCHRDFRTGNYMLDLMGGGLELTGILDWEFAGWGDPDEDVGWFCCKGWRFARLDREAGGIADRASFYEGYESAAGRRLDPVRVKFWEVLANVRWAVIALQQSDRYLVGGARDLSTAIIGRRATECDLELLLLLDPQGSAGFGPPASGRHAVWKPALREGIRDLPRGNELLALSRELLLDELLPLLPPAKQREARLIATAMSIAIRETAGGTAAEEEIRRRLEGFYAHTEPAQAAPRPGPLPASGERVSEAEPRTGERPMRADLAALLARFGAELRIGAFEPCEARARAARAILWRLTILKLCEGNPSFLAENGFGA